ncbi:MAG: hypothetical protein H6555_00730 [Lewinellaceae bacterium]|nr:hypothetical protein [Lewinellaceae bacterium]
MQVLKSFIWLGTFGILMLGTACGSDKAKEEEKDRSGINLDIQSDKGNVKINIDPSDMENTLKQLNDGESVEVVDFRKLKELLPDKLAGMPRTRHEGEKTGMSNFKFASAKAEYEEGDRQLEVAIVDVGGVGMLITGMASWSLMEMDREDDNGYERTTTIDGYKAFEKYDRQDKRGELALLAENRFIVTLKGDNLTEKEIRQAMDKIDIGRLKKLQ